MKYKNRGKEAAPVNTINECRRCLEKLGVMVYEEWMEPVKGVFSVHLRIADTYIFSNGKGSARVYALASAYGEMLERLQNFAYFRFGGYFDKYCKNLPYAVEKHEIATDAIDELPEQIWWWEQQMEDEKEREELINIWKRKIPRYREKKVINCCFKEMGSNDSIIIPYPILEYYYGSNGMAAGNTPDEAFVQALCEVLERYVVQEIIRKKIVVPDITEYACQRYECVQKIHLELKKKGLKLYIKDLSVIQEIPACACVVADSHFNFFCSFGVHPAEKLAIERTITELCQGKEFQDFKFWTSIVDEKKLVMSKIKNITSILAGNGGRMPDEFFCGKKNSRTAKFSKYENMTLKQWKENLMNIIDKMGKHLFYHDVGFLGFPSCQILVPGISEMREIDNCEYLKRAVEYYEVSKILRNINLVSKSDAERLIIYLEECDKSDTLMLDFIKIPLLDRSFLESLTVNLLLAMLYIFVENFYQASISLSDYFIEIEEDADEEMSTYYRTMIIVLKNYKRCNQEELETFLLSFTDKIILHSVMEVVENHQLVFSEVPDLDCNDCSKCKKECFMMFEKEIYMKLQTFASNYEETNYENQV